MKKEGKKKNSYSSYFLKCSKANFVQVNRNLTSYFPVSNQTKVTGSGKKKISL